MTDTSWTRTQALELRNAAAARAQMCAPIVREAEELDALVCVLDEVLGGTPTPIADALLSHASVSGSDFADPNATVNVTTQLRVLGLVRERGSKPTRAAQVASMLGISVGVARTMLSRLAAAGDIERSKRGQYRYCQR